MAAADSVWIGWLGPIQFQSSGSSVIIPASILPAADNTYDLGSATFQWRSVYVGTSIVMADAGIIGWNDLFLTRESAAVLQLGLDAAGVTNQLLKGPDRITSDGVGGNLTIAGGRNRGASAGGSIIFQTAPAAGAGVTGTLATALTIDSTKKAAFEGTILANTTGGAFQIISRMSLQGSADGKFSFSDYATGILGVGFDVTTDGTLKIRTRAQADTAILNVNGLALGANLSASGTAPTAAGTGMAFTVGTGSTSFDWSITITTANAQSAFTLTLPTASNAWTCQAQNFTTPAGQILQVTARSTTTITLTQYNTTTGLVAAFADNNVIIGTCTAH